LIEKETCRERKKARRKRSETVTRKDVKKEGKKRDRKSKGNEYKKRRQGE
jgi:hypothetical protein